MEFCRGYTQEVGRHQLKLPVPYTFFLDAFHKLLKAYVRQASGGSL